MSVFLCSNVGESEKLKPIVNGKYQTPRCLKNKKRLPAVYRYNKNAWMRNFGRTGVSSARDFGHVTNIFEYYKSRGIRRYKFYFPEMTGLRIKNFPKVDRTFLGQRIPACRTYIYHL
jgi:hypothetical protein